MKSTHDSNFPVYSYGYVHCSYRLFSLLYFSLNSRPENTKRAYEPKIEEYRRWCDSKFAHESLELRYIVNGEKAHFFLDDAVAGRSNRSKRKRANDGEESPARVIRVATLSQYGAAIVHPWERQRQMKINSNSHPRETFAPLLERVRREEEEVKKANFEDREVGTIMDDYTTTDQIADITAYYFEQ
ncbi:hypothetical protein INT47_007989 [Mucor saturninus]|uniref:Uncharacterized protein n=1 Tax=Mucor saturninus TaxID=64648 RepID=A0A8H7UUX9_9FUNG|nr:hypothetical protein INT47_007989 [Mucor saturninus]